MKTSNPIKEIRKALPELENINGNIKTISIENWGNRIKTIQTKIKNKYKKYYGVSIYAMYLNPCIIEYRDSNLIVINQEKYKLIRRYLLSDEFNIEEV